MNERWDDPYDEQDPEPTPIHIHIGLLLVLCAVFLIVFGLTLR